MKANKKAAPALAALAVAAALMLGLWYFTRPEPSQGDKTITVEVVHGDQSAREFTYHTDAEYLGQVLIQEKLVEGEDSQFGLYITTVDGETAQESENQWWCITQEGEMVNTGADTTPIQDGDHFELTLSTY